MNAYFNIELIYYITGRKGEGGEGVYRFPIMIYSRGSTPSVRLLVSILNTIIIIEGFAKFAL